VTRVPGNVQLLAAEIGQKCQSLFHDTYLLWFNALPRRTSGRSTKISGSSRADRLSLLPGPSSIAGHHLLSEIKKLPMPSQADSSRSCAGGPRYFPQSRALALHNLGPTGPAALDSALIRRDLVTRWGLSTFPGSGISSCRRLT
jgi:hypothetical protein